MSFTPEYVDPAAPFSERMLICEGECNPEIGEYDKAIHQHRSYMLKLGTSASNDTSITVHRELRMLIGTIGDWIRRLKHTPHIPETSNAVFKNGNWCRAWRCVSCGTRRYY